MKIIQLLSDKTKRVKREDLVSLEEYCAELFYSPKHEMILLEVSANKLIELGRNTLKGVKDYFRVLEEFGHDVAYIVHDFIVMTMIYTTNVSTEWQRSAPLQRTQLYIEPEVKD